MTPKSCQVIKYLVSHLPGKLGKIQLVKLVYLADLEARRVMGRPISDFNYRLYHYGPWDERFESCLKELTEDEAILVECYPYRGWYGSLYHNGKEIEYSLSAGERAILDYLIKEHGSRPMRELVEEFVYETKPMKDAQKRKAFNEPLRMELVDNELSGDFEDVDFEALAAAERELESGGGTPIGNILDELDRHLSKSGV